MYKLQLRPGSSSYSVSDNSGIVSVKLDGGASRQRRDILNAAETVDCSFVLDAREFSYFRNFYNLHVKNAGAKFLIDLLIDSPELIEYQSLFVPGSVRLSNPRGLTYNVSCQFEVIPNAIDYVAAENEVALFSAFGVDYESYIDPLHVNMNEFLPGFL